MLKFWFLTVAAATTIAVVIAAYIPPPLKAATAEVPPCGANAGWIEASPGVITCTLKNGAPTGVILSQRDFK